MSVANGGRGIGDLTALERLRRDYAFAFLTYRLEGTERRLQAAYELGRKAMVGGSSLLDVAKVHHEVVSRELLTAGDDAAIQAVVDAASAFLIEVLSTFEMAQRGFAEVRRAAVEDAARRSPESTPPT
jgi:hypothetical protein